MSTGVVASLTGTPTSSGATGSAPWLVWLNCYNAVADTTNNAVTAYSSGANWGGQRGYVNAIEL
jgi:hypothetical protein